MTKRELERLIDSRVATIIESMSDEITSMVLESVGARTLRESTSERRASLSEGASGARDRPKFTRVSEDSFTRDAPKSRVEQLADLLSLPAPDVSIDFGGTR